MAIVHNMKPENFFLGTLLTMAMVCSICAHGEVVLGAAPVEVEVEGVLKIVTNFEGEKKTKIYVLKLKTPITMAKNDEGEGPSVGVEEMQIALLGNAKILCGKKIVGEKNFKELKGQHLQLRGQLYHPDNGHHSHRILILTDVVKCASLLSKRK